MKSNQKGILNHAQDLGALIALIILIIGISVVSPESRTWSNFITASAVIHQRTDRLRHDMRHPHGCNRSVRGSVLALSTALCAGMIVAGVPAGAAMIGALAIGTGLGIVSGLLVTKGRLQPFIATLITMTVYRGLTMIFTSGKPISNLGDSFVLKLIGKGNFYRIPIPVILLVLILSHFSSC